MRGGGGCWCCGDGGDCGREVRPWENFAYFFLFLSRFSYLSYSCNDGDDDEDDNGEDKLCFIEVKRD